MKILSVKLDDNIANHLADKSLQASKSPESILADIISRYVHYNAWPQDLLELSLEAAEHGEFASPEEINSAFMRWGITPAPNPNLRWSGLALRSFRKELEHIGKKTLSTATELAKLVWQATQDKNLIKQAFPGMVEGTLEVHLGSVDYCLVFRKKDGKREFIGVVPSM